MTDRPSPLDRSGYPLLDPEPDPEAPRRASGHAPAPEPTRRKRSWLIGLAIVLLGLAHDLAIFAALGGGSGLASPWPLAWHDHPMHFHNAVITRTFLRESGTTAGYDPSFMAGYAKSAVSDPSGTPIDLFVFLVGGDRPEVAYKLFLFLAVASLPWLVAGAVALWGGRAEAILAGTLLYLIYIWTDFPLEYASLGMFTYLLVIPMGAVVTALLGRFLDRGGFGWWLASALGSTVLVLVHPLGVMIVAPAAGLAYVVAAIRKGADARRLSIGRHLGIWAIPIPVLLGNAFWWLPAWYLSSTSAAPDLAFHHGDESVWARLGQIFGLSAPVQGEIQVLLLGAGLVGLASCWTRNRILAVALGGFLLAGFGLGYLAAAVPDLAYLQLGRHTYAFYTGAAVAGSLAWAEIRRRVDHGGGRLGTWLALALVLVGVRLFGPSLFGSVAYRTGHLPTVALERTATGSIGVRIFPRSGTEPFLSSRPTPQLRWLLQTVRQHVSPGDRILYEEGGRSIRGVGDPFNGRRYSGLLPTWAGVELLGGPFLHVPVETNFTQFGEGQLFGEPEWDRDFFEQYARLYRPQAILCFSPQARAFCEANGDLIEIVETSPDGQLLFGRVRGFDGPTIEGTAEVEALPGRLTVRGLAAEVDGSVILRYHTVPGLQSQPVVPLDAVPLEGDPVPFIGLRLTSETDEVVLDWKMLP